MEIRVRKKFISNGFTIKQLVWLSEIHGIWIYDFSQNPTPDRNYLREFERKYFCMKELSYLVGFFRFFPSFMSLLNGHFLDGLMNYAVTLKSEWIRHNNLLKSNKCVYISTLSFLSAASITCTLQNEWTFWGSGFRFLAPHTHTHKIQPLTMAWRDTKNSRHSEDFTWWPTPFRFLNSFSYTHSLSACAFHSLALLSLCLSLTQKIDLFFCCCRQFSILRHLFLFHSLSLSLSLAVSVFNIMFPMNQKSETLLSITRDEDRGACKRASACSCTWCGVKGCESLKHVK